MCSSASFSGLHQPFKPQEYLLRTRLYIVSAFLLVVLFAGCSNDHQGQIEASGTLEATEVKVSAKVAEQIEKVYVQEGDQVRVGDTLMVVDRVTLALQYKQADAGVALANAQYRLLVNGARTEDIRLAEESVRQAESSFKTASEDFKRMKELLASSTITKKQFDDAESRYTITEAQLNSAKQNYQKLQRFARPEELASAKAKLDQAKASADLLNKQMNDAVILAPVSGTVTHRPVEEGELIGIGTAVVTIAKLEMLNLMIYVNETDLGKVKLGGDADIVIDTYPEKAFRGKVIYISPIAEFTPKNVQTKEDRTKLVFGVKLEVENTEGVLKAGMPADAYVK